MYTPALSLAPRDVEKLAEYAELGLWIRATDGRVLYANSILAQLLGVDPCALERSGAWLELVHPDDRERLATRWAACAWDDYVEYYTVLTPSGSAVRLEDRTLSVGEGAGGATSVTGCIRRAKGADSGSLPRPTTLRDTEVSALLASSRDLAGTLDLDDLLRRILDRLQALVGYTGAGVILREGCNWIARATSGPFGKEDLHPFPVNCKGVLVTRILQTRAPLVIDDTTTDPAVREDLLAIPCRPPALFSYIRSWVGTPLSVNDEVIGLLFVDHSEPGWFTPHRQQIVTAFSDQVAIAVKNAHTYERAQQRLAELNGVQRATRALLETLDLDAILDIACREACTLTAAEASAVFAVDSQSLELARQHGCLDMNMPHVHRMVRGCCESGASTAGDADRRRTGDTGSHLSGGATEYGVLAAPLFSQDCCMGALCVASRTVQFGEDEARALGLLADNVALAVNGAELAHQGQQVAVVKERQRLAMELHDTVTQALYSASLLVDATALALSAERHETAASNLYKLQETVDEAMRGMRVMIFQLRPPGLEEGLAVAIERRLAAVESRIGLKANLTVHDEVRLREETEAQVYWIVSEALNNVIKHSNAAHVTVELRYRERELGVTINDDGAGFDMQALPGRMGLGIAGMRERAESIGGVLVIVSEPGCGSCVALTLPL